MAESMEENKNIESNKEQKNIADETISSAAETISESEQPSTLNTYTEASAKADPQPSTINDMEVHHHAHESHAKKNWKTYFWEFLMLFLAITLGFFVENQREHYIEHQREKQFIKTLIEDIHTDTAGLNAAVIAFTLINRHIDSLVSLLEDNSSMEKNAKTIYQHAVWLHYYYKVTYFDRTIEQLKNSGNFRLIRNKNVSRSIMEYDGAMRNNVIDMQNNYIFQNKEKMLDLSNSIFKTSVVKKWLAKGWGSHEPELPKAPYFLTTEKTIIDRFINQLYQYSLATNWFTEGLKNWSTIRAVELDSLIKKEYHLK